jgi:branched-chain amino acid transport system substrate-binding protein
MRSFTVWLLAAAVAVAMVFGPVGGAAAAGDAASDIVIGFAVALSGPMQAYDGDATRMAKLFIERANAAGGLLGRRLRAVDADTRSDLDAGAAAGAAAVAGGAALVFVTCDYALGAPAARAVQAAGVLSVFLCAEDARAGVRGVGDLSFTASGAASVQGAALASFAAGARGWTRAYELLDESLDSDASVCAGFDFQFARRGGTIAGRDSFRNDATGIDDQVAHLAAAAKEKSVQAVVLCSYLPGAARALRQIRAAGIDLPVLAGSALDGGYWLKLVPDIGRLYVPAQASILDDPRPEVRALTSMYGQTYGRPPASPYAYPAYAFLQLWAKAVAAAGTAEPRAVAAMLETFADVPTVLGPRGFRPGVHIQDRMPMLIEQASAGAFRVTDTIAAADPLPPDVLDRAP